MISVDGVYNVGDVDNINTFDSVDTINDIDGVDDVDNIDRNVQINGYIRFTLSSLALMYFLQRSRNNRSLSSLLFIVITWGDEESAVDPEYKKYESLQVQFSQ